MPKKTKTPMPIAICEAKGCTEKAVHGFRELADTTSTASYASEFDVASRMNVCDAHLDIAKQLYAGKNVKYVDFSKA